MVLNHSWRRSTWKSNHRPFNHQLKIWLKMSRTACKYAIFRYCTHCHAVEKVDFTCFFCAEETLTSNDVSAVEYELKWQPGRKKVKRHLKDLSAIARNGKKRFHMGTYAWCMPVGDLNRSQTHRLNASLVGNSEFDQIFRLDSALTSFHLNGSNFSNSAKDKQKDPCQYSGVNLA